jgi:hypothetical protein
MWNVDVRRAHLRAGGEVRQGQGHIDVVRHQLQDALVEPAHGVAQEPAQVGQAPAVALEWDGHSKMVRQTDEKSRLLTASCGVKVLVKHPACR